MIFIAYLFALPAVQAKKPVEAAKKPQESASYKSSTSKWTPEKLNGKPTKNGLFATPPSQVQSAALRRQKGDKNIAEQMARDATYRKERTIAEKQKAELAQMEISHPTENRILKGKQLAARYDPRIPAEQKLLADTIKFFKNGQKAIAKEAKTLPEGEYSVARGFYSRADYVQSYLMFAKLTPELRAELLKDHGLLFKDPSRYISKEQITFMVKDGKMTREQAQRSLQDGFQTAMTSQFRKFYEADFKMVEAKPEAKTEAK